MSLMRQIGWLLAAVVLLALAGAVGINLGATRDTLQAQLRVKNSDNAQSLALALSQQHGDAALMELLLAAQFDTGFYRSVRLLRPDGGVAFTREAAATPQHAPAWFAALLPIDSPAGVAQVSDGWRALGRVEVVSHVAYAHDELWRGSTRAVGWLGLLGVAALALAAVGVRRIRRPLDATVAQAHALVEGRYVQVEEPRVPELRRVAQAMNSMVLRVRALFEAQAAQVEALRRQAHEDPLTGLAHRAHFMQRFGALLESEHGASAGALLLVRLADLAGINREHGREASDRALRALAGVLRDAAFAAGEGALAGRLNGADFALVSPRAADELALVLHAALAPLGDHAVAHGGLADWRRGDSVGALMARVDRALADAEGRAPFTIVAAARTEASTNSTTRSEGEQAWHRRVGEAIDARRARLASYPVLARGGTLVHLECPLRLQLDHDGAFEAAAQWMPLAARGHWLPRLDLLAVQLALEAIGADGQPRSVNLALASLADGGFAARLRQAVGEAPQAARGLWLEVGEAAVVGHAELLRAYSSMLRPLGVRLGLEHAGHLPHGQARLYELGLDFVKLDASLLRGAADDEAVRRFVAGSVALLHALGIQAQAEGIDDARDAQALWICGVDAITGPWATAEHRG